MSYLFGKSNNGSYKKVTQQSDTDLSDSDQETVIFRKPGEIELNLYPTSKEKKSAKNNCLNMFICISVVVVSIVFVSLAVYFFMNHDAAADVEEVKKGPHASVNTSQSFSSEKTTNLPASEEWQLPLDDCGGEGGLSFVDVDGDGVDDIIFGTTVGPLIDHVMRYPVDNFGSVGEFCKKNGKTYPCLGHIMAIRGIDRKVLWKFKIRSEVFIVDCTTFDFNKDGKKDCVGTGRQGLIVAFDPYKGEQLWVCEDDDYIKGNWNTYGVTALPDWDGDGVQEVLLPNGGDPKISPEDHNRPAGRLILLSGATGKPLGSRYMKMPDGHETYMSASLYTPKDGSQPYVLFGSGGETVPGNLYAISIADLCHYYLDVPANFACPSRDVKDMWDFMDKDNDGVMIIYKGEKKGVMVPPVMVEMTGDGIDDLVISVYDGAVILLNGQTLQQVWYANFSGMESYSTPAPGYFDDDDILDFMVHWCEGAWVHYTGSNVSVINGKDGSIMWTLDSAMMQMSSDLVLSTTRQHKDLFLYRLIGRGSNFRWDLSGTITNSDEKNDTEPDQPSDQRKRRHGDEGPDIGKLHDDYEAIKNSSVDIDDLNREMASALRSTELTCDEDLSRHTDEVFLMDINMVLNPIRALQLPMRKIYYDPLPSLPNNHHDDSDDHDDLDQPPSGMSHDGRKRRQPLSKKLCTVAQPDARTTGGIADVDGDGQLDYISLLTYAVSKISEDFKRSDMTYITVITKVNIGANLHGNKFKTIPVEAETSISVGGTDVDQTELAESILPAESQKWTEYLGKNRNSIYT